jgi:large subunit ribosomal protein L1
MDVGRAVQELKGGKVEFRVDKAGNVHVPVGKVSFGDPKLIDNASAVLDSLVKAKPSSAKGAYLLRVAVCTTMGPGVRIDPNTIHKAAAS